MKTDNKEKIKIHANVKCNCGHTAKDHYNGQGWCHSFGHPRSGECGCTFFYPNDRYIIRKKQKDNGNN